MRWREREQHDVSGLPQLQRPGQPSKGGEGRQGGRERESNERETKYEREGERRGMREKMRDNATGNKLKKTKSPLWHLQFKAFRAFYKMTVTIKQTER